MSDTLENRLRGVYEIGPNAEFGHRDFSEFIPVIQIEAANEIARLKALIVESKEALELLNYLHYDDASPVLTPFIVKLKAEEAK